MIAMRQIILVVMFVLALMSPGLARADGNAVYDRIMKTGEVRLGYTVWPPFINKDPNTGAFSGVYYDITEEIVKRMELNPTWATEISFTTYMQDLAAGKFDIEVGGWPTAVRGKLGAYTRPFFYIGYVPIVRADDYRFDTKIDKINDPGITAATLDGENSQIIRRQRFPNAKELALVQNSSPTDLLMNVITKKADVTFLDTPFVYEFLKKNPGKVRPLMIDRPLTTIPQNYTLSFDEPKLKMMMDTAIEEVLLDGTVEHILKKYDPEGRMFYQISAPYQSLATEK